jgi:hypothetical protein
LLPPRSINEKLPPELNEFYEELLKKLDEEKKTKDAVDTLSTADNNGLQNLKNSNLTLR